MDPDVNLKQQLELAEKVLEQWDLNGHVDSQDAAELAAVVKALDTWLFTGGYFPVRWKRNEEWKKDPRHFYYREEEME